ncbi:MAG: transposase family protein [Treponema sp.]|nr:transposase family protein [Treponema sp.]
MSLPSGRHCPCPGLGRHRAIREGTEAWLSRFLKLEHGIPHHDVYRQVMCRIVPEKIETCVMN